MTQVSIDITIARPADEVFAFIADFTKNGLWQTGVVKTWVTSPGPLGVGSTYTQISRFLGRDIEFNFKVTRFEANRLVAFETESGTFPVQIERRVEPAGAGARIHALIGGDAGGIFKLAVPLLDRMTRRQIEGDYARLKVLLESQ